MSKNVFKLLKIVFKLNFCCFRTDIKNTEKSRKQLRYFKLLINFFLYLVPTSVRFIRVINAKFKGLKKS